MPLKPNQSIKKAATLLRAASRHPEGVTVPALARAVSYPRATVARLVATLEEEGLVQRLPDDDRYVLGLEFVRLGRLVDPHRALILRATAVLGDLAREVRETVTLSVVRDVETLDLVLQFVGPHLVTHTSWIGQHFPHHASSSGKVLLAELTDEEALNAVALPLERLTAQTIAEPRLLLDELAQVRVTGYAVAIDELEDGLAALSVGLRDLAGRLVAIVGVSGPTFRFDERARTRALEVTRQAIDLLRGSALTAESPENATP